MRLSRSRPRPPWSSSPARVAGLAVAALVLATGLPAATAAEEEPADHVRDGVREHVLERTGEHVRTRVELAATPDRPAALIAPDRADAHRHGPAEAGATAYPDLGEDAPTQGATLELEDGVSVLGMSWDGDADVVPAMRVRQEGGSWTDWHPMPVVEGEQGADDATEGNLVVGAGEVQVQLAGPAQDATVEAWTTSVTDDDARTVATLPLEEGRLVVGTRGDWGADESVRGTDPLSLLSSTPKLGVTVHHTAGTNTYTQEQVPAVIRAIYHYHAQTLGWGDVGYGVLVDRFGRAWEGRAGGVEENIQLAHATGMNRDWQGISVIGDHDDVSVPPAVLTTLAQLTAFTLDTHGVDVADPVVYTNRTLGWTRTMPVVHGHQDVMSTLCPGARLYALLPQLRQLVGELQAEGVTATQRIGGDDRYAVAARLAREAFLEGTGTAYLASGESLADALGVGPVADAAGAAVLLAKVDAVPQATLAALQRLGVREVVLAGGETVLGRGVADELAVRGYVVRRLSGPNRYATAAQLATAEPATGGTVYVASGVELVDALGGAASAAQIGGELLLTKPDGLPAVTSEALRTLARSRVVVLGGEAAVLPAVVDQLGSVLPGVPVDRLGGTDRYRTSALVALDAFPEATSAVVAAGTAPVDAIAGTQVAARHDAPVVLARETCLPASVRGAYDRLGVTLSRLAGGSGVLGWGAGSQSC